MIEEDDASWVVALWPSGGGCLSLLLMAAAALIVWCMPIRFSPIGYLVAVKR